MMQQDTKQGPNVDHSRKFPTLDVISFLGPLICFFHTQPLLETLAALDRLRKKNMLFVLSTAHAFDC